jgi:hypothetical protein
LFPQLLISVQFWLRRLLPDREPATAQAWLAARSTIAIVARDRGGEYLMENASRAFPRCRPQVTVVSATTDRKFAKKGLVWARRIVVILIVKPFDLRIVPSRKAHLAAMRAGSDPFAILSL